MNWNVDPHIYVTYSYISYKDKKIELNIHNVNSERYKYYIKDKICEFVENSYRSSLEDDASVCTYILSFQCAWNEFYILQTESTS